MITQKNFTSLLLLLAIGGLVVLGSCKHELPIITVIPVDTTGTGGGGDGDSDLCDPDSVYFEKDILPMIISNCAMSGCHDAATHAEGVNLSSYASVMNTAEVVPFDPGDSKLYEVITENDVDDIMPPWPATPLSGDQVALISKWIQQGALNITCDANAGGCDSTNVTYSAVVAPILQTYCNGCHNAVTASGGIVLDEYGGAAAVALNGKLVGTISFADGFAAMPPGGSQMPSCEIAQIKKWVSDGAPDN